MSLEHSTSVRGGEVSSLCAKGLHVISDDLDFGVTQKAELVTTRAVGVMATERSDVMTGWRF